MKSTSLDDESDGCLIRRFANGRDERAFAKLVERRGALVAGVCARMLRQREDAEDAFQSVFMVLARRAASLRRDGSLAGWLHAVAVRVCLNARTANVRQQRRLQEAAAVKHPSQRSERLTELKQVVDEELAALPQRLREVLVLCDLDGQTRDEVARALALPVGTVSSRLARGRAAMRKRLARHGPSFAVGGVAYALAKCGQAAPAVSAELVQTTVCNANIFLAGTATANTTLSTSITTLANGAIYAMIIHQWKTAACCVAVVAASLFGTAVAPSVVPGLVSTASAATIFHDDFEDGSATDGSPVTWRAAGFVQETIFSVVQGNLNVLAAPGMDVGAIGVDQPLVDGSIRAVLRINGVGDQNAGVVFRANDVLGISYAAEIEADGDVFMGIANVYTRITTDLRPTEEDVILQLDVVGNELSVWAWRTGESMPQAPLLTGTDTANQLTIGLPGVYSGQSNPRQPTPSTAIFRYVHVADMSIPEPRGASLAVAGGAALAGGLFFGRRRLILVDRQW